MDIDRDYIEELLDQRDPTYVIKDDHMADWAVERVLEQQTEADRVIAIIDSKISALQAQKLEVMQRRDRRTSFLSSKLYEYFSAVEPRRTKTTATYQLASGALVLKAQQPEYVRDEPAVIEWAEKNAPQYIRVTKSINWGDLKRDSVPMGEELSLIDTGELIPGVAVKAREPKFEVR